VILAVLFVSLVTARGQTTNRPTSISILDFGKTPFASAVTDKLRLALKPIEGLTVLDPELSRAAARGAGYSGSLNMLLTEARDLGAALSSDFYLIGDAQTLRRSSSTRPVFYESYCSIFVISSRSGKLTFWDRLHAEAASPPQAEQELLNQLQAASLMQRLYAAIKFAVANERSQRALTTPIAPLIKEAPEDEKAAQAQGLRLPRPFRRLRPHYPATAAKADAEATVDVVVDVGADGEVSNIEVVRWAGFGLDEATIATVSQLHFFPAMRDGTPVPLRVLLRYNFRKPVK
jgi:TonB family protein